MLNCLYKNIDWSSISYVGFDMDGTLYDEFDFIRQVYSQIADDVSIDIKNDLLERWLEKGSSYPYIFSEIYKKFLSNSINCQEDEFVHMCVNKYRNFIPNINLSVRTEFILEFMKKRYTLFLVTDGNKKLQTNKVSALKLDRYFKTENIFYTCDYEKNKETLKLHDLALDIPPERTVFLGDRDIDKKFAQNSNIKFIQVYNMVEIVR